MKFKYIIQEFDGERWFNVEELGLFESEIEANEEIYRSIENKNDFWTRYKVVQCEIKS